MADKPQQPETSKQGRVPPVTPSKPTGAQKMRDTIGGVAKRPQPQDAKLGRK